MITITLQDKDYPEIQASVSVSDEVAADIRRHPEAFASLVREQLESNIHRVADEMYRAHMARLEMWQW